MRRSAAAMMFMIAFLLGPSSEAEAIDMRGMRTIGNVVAVSKAVDGLLLDCDDKSQVRLQLIAPDLVRVKTSFKKSLPHVDHSYAIARTDWEPVQSKFVETSDAVMLETSELRVSVTRSPLRIAFYDVKTNRQINADDKPMQFNSETGAIAATKIISEGTDEHFYGLGEKAAHLDKTHGEFEMWTSDTPAYKLGTDPIYQSIPFYIGLLSGSEASKTASAAYGIFFDNTFHTHFDMGSASSKDVILQSDGGEMDYYFFYGPSMKKVVSRYTELTGRMPLPPKWALGNQQSRWSYKSEKEVKDVVSRYLVDNIPLDVIHLDIDYMNGYRVFTFDPIAFPDPPGLMKWLAERGVKAVAIIDPGVKYEPGGKYKVFNEGTDQNYFLKQKDGKTYVGAVWPGKAVFVDYTLPSAAKWWGDQHSVLLDAGVSGIWNDMNEPADFESRDGLKWKDVVNDDGGQQSMHAKMRNVFAMLECKATYDGLSRLRPNERPYLITRSGYAGIQRYSTMWTGDCNSSWDALALSIPMFETLGLCGESFVGADCGGFIGHSNGELLARWYQVGFLSPFFRNHHANDDCYQEPWRFGEKYEDVIRKYVQLRYRLLPYLYTVLAEAHETGVPWIRPLILENQDDQNALTIDDEFMVGDKLLCAPILKSGILFRDVYLPEGDWYNFFTHERLKGGQHISVQAPLDTVPLFVKAGTVLPFGPAVSFVGQKSQQPLTYQVFVDSHGKAKGALYEDDGHSPAYLNGECDHFSLKFEQGKLISTSAKDKFEKVLSNDVVNLCTENAK